MSIEQRRKVAQICFDEQMRRLDEEEGQLLTPTMFDRGIGPVALKTLYDQVAHAAQSREREIARLESDLAAARAIAVSATLDMEEARTVAMDRGLDARDLRRIVMARGGGGNHDSNVEAMLNIVEDIKQLIPDQKYMDLMNLLSKMHS